MISIFLIGASGVGKTTLAEWISQKYGIPKLDSASRAVFAKEYKEKYKNYDNLMADQPAYKEFQAKVFHLQAAMERSMSQDYVSDRAFDHIVYASMYGMDVHETYASQEFGLYLTKFIAPPKDIRPVLFFVRPTGMCYNAAREGKERTEFLVWDDIQRFDGALEFLMHIHKIPYIPISCARMRERTALVDAVVGPLLTKPVPYGQARRDWGTETIRYQKDGFQHVDSVATCARLLMGWMKRQGISAGQINLSKIGEDCPLIYLKLRNEDQQRVIECAMDMEETGE